MRKTLLSLIAILAFVAQPSVSSVFYENSMLSGRKGKIYSINVKNAEGKDVKMKQYKGKVLLIVNTATRCGFTPQYKELESMYEKYHAQGLEVLDFPCNQFGEQAPGTIAEIRQFCTSNYNTQFEQFAKIDVNGDDASPLFTYLKAQKGFGGFDTSDQRGKFMDDMMRKRDADLHKVPCRPQGQRRAPLRADRQHGRNRESHQRSPLMAFSFLRSISLRVRKVSFHHVRSVLSSCQRYTFGDSKEHLLEMCHHPSGNTMFSTSCAAANNGAISSSRKPAMPQPIRVTRNVRLGLFLAKSIKSST